MDTLEQLIGDEGRRVDGEAAKALIETQPLVFFGCRVCPFAQRAWWAAAELGLDATWTYVHIDLGARKPAWYAKSVNPFGTVPCLYAGPGRGVFESLIVCEYLNAVGGGALLPADPYALSSVRLITARFDDTVRAPLYALLTNQHPEKDAELQHALTAKLEALDRLYAERQQPGGPFLLGPALSLAEIAMLPFLERFHSVLRHYRGYELFPPGRHPALAAAFHAARARPAFARTTAPPEYFIAAYRGYATGAAGGAASAPPQHAGPKDVVAAVAAVGLALLPILVSSL